MVNERGQQPSVPPDPPADEPEDEFRLATSADFDGALRALEDYEDSDEVWEPGDDDAVVAALAPVTPPLDEPEMDAAAEPEPWEAEVAPEAPPREPGVGGDRALYAPRPVPPPAGVEEDERLRAPRAQGFRRRLHNQIGLLPLTLWLLALGAYLLARGQEVESLPDYSDAALAAASALVGGFTAVWHALLSGRRERGLLFFGLYVLVTAGLIAGLVTFVDESPDAAEWWPLLLGSLGVTLFLVFAVDRGHDPRLLWVGLLLLVAGGTAYAVENGQVSQDVLDRARDYWPLLFALLGLGVLPLAVRRRVE